jgi:UDP-2,3-diacylglucosamine hydrolase
MKAYFISDLHIRHEDKTKGIKLMEFLKALPKDTTHLVLLGDIFDLWIGSHEYFIKKFSKIIKELKAISDRGVEIHYFEGNHDIHLKKFWHDELGINVHTDHYYFNFDGIVIRAEHGDLMNKEDKGYLFLRKALRTFPMNILSTQLPGKLVEAIGDRSSRVSRFYTDRQNQKYKEKVKALTQDYAQEVYNEKPFDIIITGHTHVDDDFSFEAQGKKARSINLGSWLDRPKALIVTKEETKFIDL